MRLTRTVHWGLLRTLTDLHTNIAVGEARYINFRGLKLHNASENGVNYLFFSFSFSDLRNFGSFSFFIITEY